MDIPETPVFLSIFPLITLAICDAEMAERRQNKPTHQSVEIWRITPPVIYSHTIA